jgi:bifunctional non-homologous end joining protein LigD
MRYKSEYDLPKVGAIRAKMPGIIKPMYALLAKLPGDQNHYGFEYKWDGVRAIFFWNGSKAFLQSRNLIDITELYPEIKPLAKSGVPEIILDGEIITLDQKGRPSFNLLQHRFSIADPAEALKRSKQIPAIYMIFDILFIEHYSLLSVQYKDRRTLLDSLNISGPSWQIPPWQKGGGSEMFEAAGQLGFEGIVAKKLDSIYEQDMRRGAWIKTKLVNSQEFVIGGWAPLNDPNLNLIGALLVGYYKNGRLIFAGSVGTGFTEKDRKELRGLFIHNPTTKNPFDGPPPRRDALYIEPKFVAEIEFRGWTGKELLRQPSFKGIRFDKDPSEIVREDLA